MLTNLRLLFIFAIAFTISNFKIFGCPICVDAIGHIKKPFFKVEVAKRAKVKKGNGNQVLDIIADESIAGASNVNTNKIQCFLKS